MFVSMLMVLSGITHAQDNATPAPAAADAPATAAAPAQTEMQKWIASTDAQWQTAFKRDVTDVHEAELNKLKLQYLTSLEDAIKKASGASDLDGAVALRNEQKRFGDTNVFPKQDEAADVASVKQLRAAIRIQLARLEKDNAIRAKAVHTKYDQVLAQAQAQLTQRQRLDDALLIKAKRDEVASAWITPAIKSASEKAEVATTPVAKLKAAPAAADQKALGWRFHGFWTTEKKESRVQFTPGGTFKELWNGTVQEGRWKATSDTDATITLKKGKVHNYHVSDDSADVKPLKRLTDGYRWAREN